MADLISHAAQTVRIIPVPGRLLFFSFKICTLDTMDPSIIKLLEEDEDETMHPGAYVDAFTEALNRDIQGDDSSNLQDSACDAVKQSLQSTEQHLPHLEQVQNSFSEQNFANSSDQHIRENSEEQGHEVQQLISQQPVNNNLSNDHKKRTMHSSSLQLDILVPEMLHLLDKDQSTQLHALYNKLLNNKISNEHFVRVCKINFGDRIIREAAANQVKMQVQSQATWTTNQKHYSCQASVASQSLPCHNMHVVVDSSPRLPHMPPKTEGETCLLAFENTNTKTRELESALDVKHGLVTETSATSMSAINNEGALPMVSQKAVNDAQQIPLAQGAFSMYRSSLGSHAYHRPSISTTSNSLKLHNQDSQLRQFAVNLAMTRSHVISTQPTNIATLQSYELHKVVNDGKMHDVSMSCTVKQHQKHVTWQQQSSNVASKEIHSNSQPRGLVGKDSIDHGVESQKKKLFVVPQKSSFPSVLGEKGSLKDELHEGKLSSGYDSKSTSIISKIPGSSANITDKMTKSQTRMGMWNLNAFKKPSIGKKKVLESSDDPPPQLSKKQKTSVVLLDQSIEQLNDVTAVSGVNLREEEEQLRSIPKEEAQASEAVKRVVLEDEERLILQKGPLQRKLAQIISRCGLDGASHDVEHFLSMCVEERLRGFISSLIRLSKQRIDVEKNRHQLLLTSDVQHQILAMNQKAKEEWEKKQAEEIEKFRKTSGNSRTDAEKHKDDGHSKVQKSHRVEADKVLATAANVAARAAIGVDDILSKWQLMAEQARQKREGKLCDSLGYKQGESSHGKLAVSLEDPWEQWEDGGMRRSTVLTPHPEMDRTISMKDVLATLEREPQMARSTLVYRLHGRTFGNVGAG